MPNFVPKRPVKSFLDLEVYQKSLEAAVFVSKYVVLSRPVSGVEIVAEDKAEKLEVKAINYPAELIFKGMLPCALGLPHLIAEAHSLRFGSSQNCLVLLERAMLYCNKMVVYLEEARDIAQTGLSCEKFQELIKKYLYIRQKILNLQRSWKKYMNA